MPDDGEQTQRKEPWSGDAFDRKPFADYLTKVITARSQRMQQGEGGGATVAIDADWGAGKTFFVKNWAEDLKEAGHPVIYFDAWENDDGDQPAIALMSAILQGLKEWESRIPAKKRLAETAADLTKRSIRDLRSAVLPATGVIARGMVKKFTGVAIDQLMDSFDSVDQTDDADNDSKELNEALDKFFESALASHEKRQRSLADFRSNLASLLELVCSQAGAVLPLFVFVDELDRCRPSYAIKLLEEVKHIFGIRGVAFVVSTNLMQFQNSIRGVYGGDFDGRRYLRRMFDHEYLLPEPKGDMYQVIASEIFEAHREGPVVTGLPDGQEHDGLYVWTLVSSAVIPGDVRTQKQALRLANEVQAGLSERDPLHLLWLFYLCALYVSDRESLGVLVSGEIRNRDVRGFIAETLKSDPRIRYQQIVVADEGLRRRVENREVVLSVVIGKYIDMCHASSESLRQEAFSDGYDYPSALAEHVYQDLVRGSKRVPAIAGYPAAVRDAGFFAGPG
ncbi:KAP family P-loop NTPase fold protein [Marilutibacter chinensis]|uniref:KAP family NTPase n=1 Tax=Marilutibacter chinensis TaxID=2912247 RepID=A0ABS9HT23_9GAMM|nr:P-loop NTPase fold protein [Lysobacter chinensis]MCF7221448.1 KAP family NTPase [Lysobacter chinensis]